MLKKTLGLVKKYLKKYKFIVITSVVAIVISTGVVVSALINTERREEIAQVSNKTQPALESKDTATEITENTEPITEQKTTSELPIQPVYDPKAAAREQYLKPSLKSTISAENEGITWQCFLDSFNLLREKDPGFPGWDSQSAIDKVVAISVTMNNPCSTQPNNYILSGKVLASYVLAKHCDIDSQGHFIEPANCRW